MGKGPFTLLSVKGTVRSSASESSFSLKVRSSFSLLVAHK